MFLFLFLSAAIPSALFPQGTEDRLRQALSLERESIQAQERGDVDLAIDRSRKAGALYRELGERGGEAACLLFVGFLEKSRKHFREALVSLVSSLEIYEALKLRSPPEQIAEAHFFLAESYVGLGQRDQAIHHLDAASGWFHSVENRKLAASGLENLGALEVKISRLSKAAALFEEALRLLRESKGTKEEVGSYIRNLAEVYQLQGQFDKALSLIQDAIQLNPGASDYETLASVYRAKGDYTESLSASEHAEELFRQAGNQSGVWVARTGRAATLYAQGKVGEALVLYQDAVKSFQALGDEDQLPAALTGVGTALHLLGRYEEARKAHQTALEIRRRTGNKSGEAAALNNLGTVELSLGNYEQALAYLEQSLSLRRVAGDQQGEATALINTAFVYADLGRLEESLGRFTQAVHIAQAIGDRSLEAAASQYIAQVLGGLGRTSEALALCNKALDKAREIGHRPVELAALKLQGYLLLVSDEGRRALAVLSRAEGLSREIGDRAMEAEILTMTGFVLLKLGHSEDSRKLLQKALRIEEEIGNLNTKGLTLNAIAVTEEALGHGKEAILAYRQVIDLKESFIEETRTDELVSGLVGSSVEFYGRLIQLLWKAGDASESFAIAERARSRSLLRQIGRRTIDLRKETGSDLVEEERRLRENLKRLDQRIWAESRKLSGQDRAMIDSLGQMIDQSRRQYETVLIRLKQTSPEYASLVHPSVLSLAEAQKLLDQDTTLIEYFVLDERTLAWIIERGSCHLVDLVLTAQTLRQRVAVLRSRIGGRDSGGDDAMQLYRDLFAPLEPHIRHRKLLIVPHSVLHSLPFVALQDGKGRFLAERFSITLLPSASVLPFLIGKRSPNKGRLLALGDPDGSLTQAAQEARAVATLYSAEPLLGSRATEGALRARSKGIDLLHISAHATFDKARPLFSRIELASGDGEDGHLEVHEVFNLDLTGTNLVVLSGCGTGLGTPTEGDDIVNFSRAFLYAGSPSVLATLWPVDDAASAALMESFYRHLRQGRSPAGALQSAQLEISKQERWRAPYYWAGYTLIGDGGVADPSLH